VSEPIEEPVPKLPRGRGLRLSKPELFRIALTLITLIGVVVLTKPCANAVSGFVTSFDGSGSANEKAMPKPGNVDVPAPGQGSGQGSAIAEPQYETLKPGMTDDEIRAAIERSKARNAGSANAGSANAGTANAGSTPGPAGSAATAPGSAGSAATAPGSAGSAATAPTR
jgi:hypothetical protein